MQKSLTEEVMEGSQPSNSEEAYKPADHNGENTDNGIKVTEKPAKQQVDKRIIDENAGTVEFGLLRSATFPPTSPTIAPTVRLGYIGEQLSQIIFPMQPPEDRLVTLYEALEQCAFLVYPDSA